MCKRIKRSSAVYHGWWRGSSATPPSLHLSELDVSTEKIVIGPGLHDERGMMVPHVSIIQRAKTAQNTSGRGGLRRVLLVLCAMLVTILICGCGLFTEGAQIRQRFQEANDLFNQGKYPASLTKYEQIIAAYPEAGDRGLFEMGIVHAYPENQLKDYQKSLDCFHKLVKDYPESGYRKDSEQMVFSINNVTFKDMTIAAQQAQIEALRRDVEAKGSEISTLHSTITALEQILKNREGEIVSLQQEISALQKGPADKILVEKKARRLTLFAKGTALKTYRIALGGNPSGAKERQGDNKTPEGTYVIDSRNRDSRYHRSLHISYPNEMDQIRARGRGVSPGGDIMIHGIKNGFSWVGDLHANEDWTKGCIAVTDEEIEEIDKLVPNGTPIEIRP